MSEAVEKALSEVKRIEGAIATALAEQKQIAGDSSQKLGTRIDELNRELDGALKKTREELNDEFSKTNEENKELKRRVEDLEKRLGHPGGGSGTKGVDRVESKSFGEQFTDALMSAEWQREVGGSDEGWKGLKTRRRSPEFSLGSQYSELVKSIMAGSEQKSSVLSTDATRFVAPYRRDIVDFPMRSMTLRSLVPTIPIASNSFEYVQHQGTGPDTALAVTTLISGDGVTATTTATLTAAAAHGLKVGDYIQVLDSTDTEYNGVWRVRTVTSSTVFTFTLASTPVDAAADGTILYRPLSFGGAAAEKAEGAASAQAEFAWELKTGSVRIVSHYIPVGENILDDIPQLRAKIDNTMVYGVQLKEERQGWYGAGTGVTLQGLTTTPGIITASGTAATILDSVRSARTQVALSDGFPSAVCMNPIDWEYCERQKGSDDHYIMGGGALGNDPRIWRLPVYETNSLLPGDVIVGDFARGAELYDRHNATISFTDSHGENFTSDLLVIKCSSRIAWVWTLPQYFVHLTIS